MATEFTPGPWSKPLPVTMTRNAWAALRPDEPLTFVTATWDGMSGETVAIVYGDNDEQEAANARLISAAPKLFDALERIIDAYGFDPSVDSSIWQEAHTAIADVRGEQVSA